MPDDSTPTTLSVSFTNTSLPIKKWWIVHTVGSPTQSGSQLVNGHSSNNSCPSTEPSASFDIDLLPSTYDYWTFAFLDFADNVFISDVGFKATIGIDYTPATLTLSYADSVNTITVAQERSDSEIYSVSMPMNLVGDADAIVYDQPVLSIAYTGSAWTYAASSTVSTSDAPFVANHGIVNVITNETMQSFYIHNCDSETVYVNLYVNGSATPVNDTPYSIRQNSYAVYSVSATTTNIHVKPTNAGIPDPVLKVKPSGCGKGEPPKRDQGE